jgi:hypothetical protein
MKKIIVVAGFFAMSAAQAEVYKCTDPAGKIIYQSTECTTGSAGQVDIKQFDPKKIAEAQAKLAESLKRDAELEAAAAEAAQKERELETREALASQVRNQAEALNRNAAAQENANQIPQTNYYIAPPPAYVAPAPMPTPDKNINR